ncbi:DUF2190 family protein [Sphingomonas morindae]|uniref:DUF2190 family protein n=1 Tax=Sphingomonas morindae TaxID=1541170 RepID=A0ABY4X418_9SPHN|nr:DUF2190 family protein [Sphingomonas morindae]USI71621.1 DUF2190 family protein [Sphingomonas morindae]
MNNFRHPGDVCTFAAPYAVASGGGFLVGALFAVALIAAAPNAPVEGRVTGVVVLPKAAGAVTPGQKLYWDDGAKVVTTTAQGNTLIGAALSTQAAGDPNVTVRLNGTVTA